MRRAWPSTGFFGPGISLQHGNWGARLVSGDADRLPLSAEDVRVWEGWRLHLGIFLDAGGGAGGLYRDMGVAV